MTSNVITHQEQQMPRVTRADLINSAVGFMMRFNYPATREAVNKALGSEYLPGECARAGYADNGGHSIRAEKLLVTAILTKLIDRREGLARAEAYLAQVNRAG